MIQIGFMSPEGIIYTCKAYEHINLAKDICSKLHYSDEIKKYNCCFTGVDCESYLLARGFLGIYSRTMVHRCQYGVKIGNTFFPPVQLSEKQLSFIKDNLTNAFNADQLDAMYDILKWNECAAKSDNSATCQ